MNHDELRRQARHLIVGCPGCDEDSCIYCLVPGGDDILDQLMELVNQRIDTVLADLNSVGRELWTADEVAGYLGLLDANGARARLSQWKIRAAKTVEHPATRRSMALYPADEVRAKHEARKAAKR